jgi:hypothetical protein
MQELTALYTGSLRSAPRRSHVRSGYGDTDTGAHLDDIVVDHDSQRALFTIIGDADTEHGLVTANGPVAEAIPADALEEFVADHGEPATSSPPRSAKTS